MTSLSGEELNVSDRRVLASSLAAREGVLLVAFRESLERAEEDLAALKPLSAGIARQHQ